MNDVTSKPTAPATAPNDIKADTAPAKPAEAAKASGGAKVTEADRNDEVRANAVAAMEEMEAIQPTPTQEELNRIHRGETASYKTRQTKA